MIETFPPLNRRLVTPPPPTGLKVKWRGVFDMGELYRAIKVWLEDKGYADERDLEEKYIERRKPTGKQLEIQWRSKKKISNYFSFVIDLTMLVIALKDVEVKQGDATLKLNHGEIELRIVGYVDTNKEFEKLGALNKIYFKIIVNKRLEQYKGDLYSDVYNLQGHIKRYLTLHRT